MSFLAAARAALSCRSRLSRTLAAVGVTLAAFFISCGGSSSHPVAPNHKAFVTLPAFGSVLQLDINGSNGAITIGPETPRVDGLSPTGLALAPSKKFLYTANSRANSISIFNVAGDGTLTLSGQPIAAGAAPNAMVVDPSGSFLLVTNNFGDNVSVYSIDSGSGALSEVAGSPFFANANPTEIEFTHSGKFVYVTNPGIGMVTGFAFSGGVLSSVPGSPFSAVPQGGAAALAVDGGDRFLYVTNPSAPNPPPNTATVGNISGFHIDPNSGRLTPITGSPFTATNGKAPTAITVDPSGKFVYATTPGSSFSVWCFTIDPTTGELTAVTSSPFSQAAGGLFALIDPSGNYFYIGSSEAVGVQGYTYNTSSGVPAIITGSPFVTPTAPGEMVLLE